MRYRYCLCHEMNQIDNPLICTKSGAYLCFKLVPYFFWNHVDCQSKFGKVVLSVGAALRMSFFCPRLVLGLSSFVLFVFLLSLQCLCDAPVMSQACPQVSKYSFCCLNHYLFSSRRLQQRLTKETRKTKLIPQHVLFIDS